MPVARNEIKALILARHKAASQRRLILARHRVAVPAVSEADTQGAVREAVEAEVDTEDNDGYGHSGRSRSFPTDICR